MKKRLTAGLCALVMLLAAGCGRGDSDAYRQINSQISQSQDAGAPAPGAPRNQRPRELTGHLTIKTFWDEQMETIIQDFTALHPGVTIDLVKAGGENDVRSLDDYGTQTVVELMSGGYDLGLTVTGKSFKDVALFVAQRLAPLDSVESTATHFVLKTYKQGGVMTYGEETDEREGA